MKFACPDCGCTVFLRAVRRVELVRSWLPWLAPRECVVGYYARCESCHTDVKIGRDVATRLRVNQPAPAPQPPADKENKPGIEPHRTPGLEWSRGTR